MLNIPNFFSITGPSGGHGYLKPRKVIYVDLKGDQRVYISTNDGGYQVDHSDERNVNCEQVKPVLDIENYDGITYQGVLERQVR